MRQLVVVVTIVFATPGLSGACRARQNAPASQDMDAMDSTEQHATLAAQEAMGGPMPADPHMTLTPLRPGSVADSTRAAVIVAQMRAALGKYRDVRVAEADGFRQFLPGVPQPVYHFTNRRWALAEMLRFDPAKTTSLLYRKQPGGTFELVGAMYAAPGRASLDQLDARVPLSVARWHEHVNWCVPPRAGGSCPTSSAGWCTCWRSRATIRTSSGALGTSTPIRDDRASRRTFLPVASGPPRRGDV